ncbi:hypothetical protein GDO78_015997 [Eleutherodactylus coqui]|uniref:Uncharacterized protein n=1 Tax=Eleutherodactylus coqui TaxID=57060 RepID=A0A8J6EKJ0_ELECQ|nr:hypothetical protein GDO78_015997 [Eleutherodactylus coqui]
MQATLNGRTRTPRQRIRTLVCTAVMRCWHLLRVTYFMPVYSDKATGICNGKISIQKLCKPAMNVPDKRMGQAEGGDQHLEPMIRSPRGTINIPAYIHKCIYP